MPPPPPSILSNGIYSLPVNSSYIFKVQDSNVFPIYKQLYGETSAGWWRVRVVQEDVSVNESTSSYPANNELVNWINDVLDDHGGSENYQIDNNGQSVWQLTIDEVTLL